jgi:hypothetical protein
VPRVPTVIPEPMLARLTDRLPTGPTSSYEVKWDGYRCLALKSRRRRHAKVVKRQQSDRFVSGRGGRSQRGAAKHPRPEAALNKLLKKSVK